MKKPLIDRTPVLVLPQKDQSDSPFLLRHMYETETFKAHSVETHTAKKDWQNLYNNWIYNVTESEKRYGGRAIVVLPVDLNNATIQGVREKVNHIINYFDKRLNANNLKVIIAGTNTNDNFESKENVHLLRELAAELQDSKRNVCYAEPSTINPYNAAQIYEWVQQTVQENFPDANLAEAAQKDTKNEKKGLLSWAKKTETAVVTISGIEQGHLRHEEITPGKKKLESGANLTTTMSTPQSYQESCEVTLTMSHDKQRPGPAIRDMVREISGFMDKCKSNVEVGRVAGDSKRPLRGIRIDTTQCAEETKTMLDQGLRNKGLTAQLQGHQQVHKRP